MSYKSNISGTTSTSFSIGDKNIVIDGDIVKIVYPDLTEFIIADASPTSGMVGGDPAAVEGVFDSPPLGYLSGQLFAVSNTPSGEFVGHAGAVAIYENAAWQFIDPVDGWVILDKSEGRTIAYDPDNGWIGWTISPSDVRAAVDAATDSNVFTDAYKLKLDGIEAGATTDLTALEILNLLKTVDGTGSGLDADRLNGYTVSYLLDLPNATGLLPVGSFNAGVHGNLSGGSLHSVATTLSSGFMSSSDKSKLDGIEAGATADLTASEIRALVDAATDSNVFTDTYKSKLDGIEAGATADLTASEILTLLQSVDGAGSSLDADLLDGQHGAYYATSASPTITGVASITNAIISGSLTVGGNVTFADAMIVLNDGLTAQSQMGLTLIRSGDPSAIIAWDEALGYWVAGTVSQQGRIWTENNDGSSSGLDADLLDGRHGSYYLDLNNSSGNLPTARFDDVSHGNRGGGSLHTAATQSVPGFMSASDKLKLDGISDGANNYTLPSSVVHRNASADITAVWEWQDSIQARFGTSGDSAISYNGTSNILVIEGITPDAKIELRGRTSASSLKTMISADPNGAVYLTYEGVEKLTTTSTGLNITGNIVIDGFVDGYDINELGEKLDGIEPNATADMTALEIRTLLLTVDGPGSTIDADLLDGYHAAYFAPISSPNLQGAPTAPTAAYGTNTTQIASTAFVQNAISLTGPSFLGLAVGSLAGKAVEISAAAAIEILTYADGSGSALDADLLDGNHGSYYLSASNLNSGTLPAARFNDTSHGSRSGGSLHSNATTLISGFMSALDKVKLDGIESGATGDLTANEILSLLLTVDGPGSGIDADTLDGYDASNFAVLNNTPVFSQSISNSTFNGQSLITLSNTNDSGGNFASMLFRTGDLDSSLLSRVAISASKGSADNTGKLTIHSRQNDLTWAPSLVISELGLLSPSLGVSLVNGSVGSPSIRFNSSSTTGLYYSSGIAFSVSGTKRASITSSGLLMSNTGSGALLDVDASGTVPSIVPDWSDTNTGIGTSSPDTLELIVGGVSALTVTSSMTTVHGDMTVEGTTFTVNSETLTIDDNIILLNNNVTGTPTEDAGIEVERGTSTNASILWSESDDTWKAGLVGNLHKIWTAGNDGSGSGLDADTLDGYQSSDFTRKSENSIVSGTWTFPNVIFNPGSASVPSISFTTSLDTGIYLSTPGRIGFSSSGSLQFSLDTGFFATNSSGPSIVNSAASSTAPTIIPNRSSSTTGIGSSSAGTISSIVNGSEVMRVSSSGVNVISGEINVDGYIISPKVTTTLADNTSTPTVFYSFAHASFKFVAMDYYIVRGGSTEYGTLLVSSDGTTADKTQTFGTIGALCGVSFTVNINGLNTRVLYTTTSTGSSATLTYSIRRF